MDLRIEISGGEAICHQDGRAAFAAPLKELASALGTWSDLVLLPEVIPDGVRFIRSRGQVTVLVMEDLPQVRTVKWLCDDSPRPFGPGAQYRTVRLAFPFVVIIVALRMGGLTGYQQCYYRTQRLRTLDDELLFPNLYNVANGYQQQCWLCLANIRRDLTPLSWHDKVNTIHTHIWAAGFNQSSEVHEGMSYWQKMRDVDDRVASLAAWEQATQGDPLFPLAVKWRSAECTVGDVVDGMLAGTGSPRAPETLEEWVRVLAAAARRTTRGES